jgi:hypothetical protein
VFEEAQWSVRAVLPLRSPLEVARSLNRRDGLGVSWGCLLWLRHVLDAEVETRAMPRAVLDWSRFLGDRRGALTRVANQLELVWPNGSESAFADIDELVSPDMRHHTATEADLHAHPAIGELIRETYSAMLELGDDPKSNFVLKRLDDLRARFEIAAAIFAQATRELEDDLQSARSRAVERDAFAAQLAVQRGAVAQLSEELAVQRGAVAQLSEELAVQRGAVAQLSEELAVQRGAAAQLSAERDKLTLQLSAANEQIGRAEAAITHIGSRYAEKYGASKRGLFRSLSKTTSRRSTAPSVNRKDLEAIRNSVFFDESYYLETNPDVREKRLDAALHYLVYGWLEGRDPGPFFSTEAYLARHPDIGAASLNPLLHYEAHGRGESRGVLPRR